MVELKTSDVMYILDLLQKQGVVIILDRDNTYKGINDILEEEYKEE